MNTVQVELRPHVGKNYNLKLQAIVEIEHDQWIVMASINGGPMTQVGYIGKREGAPFNGIDTLRSLPASIRDQIKDAIEVQRGGEPVRMFVPAEPSPLLVGEEDEDRDGDEDEDEDGIDLE